MLGEVIHLIESHYPGLGPAVRAALAVFGSLALAQRTKPLTLIFEGASGSGKTTVLQMVFPIKDSKVDLVYRSDKFTPKAFVSHAASVKKENLDKIDMLPRLRNKVLVTKELAPIFRGRQEDLTETFSILISVLDGKGFISDSGIRGRRGYDRPIIFNWLGATTPLPPGTYRLMSQLGNRILFFEIDAPAPHQDDLLAFAKSDTGSQAETDCQKVVNDLLAGFFLDHPIGSVAPGSIKIPDHLSEQLVQWASLLVKGRAEIKSERAFAGAAWEPVAALPAEVPYRVIEYFKELARGHALIQGRAEVNEDDLELVAHVAISSIPGHLRPLVRELRETGSVTTADCKRACRVSSPTARRYLKELSVLGIGKLTKGETNENSQDVIRLSRDFAWLFQGLAMDFRL